MKPEDIAYTAKVSAAVWMIRKARKIASLLGDRMPEEQQAIEEEIVEIGRRMYEEACRDPQPEVTHDLGEDHELEAYVSAVRELVPDAERWFVANDYYHGFSVEQSAERWRDHELEAYIAAVRELVPDADRSEIEQYRSNHGISPEETAKRWKIWKQLQESQKQ